MKKQIKSKRKTIVFVAVAAVIFMFAANYSASAQGKFKVGDRVECDIMQTGKWEKGKIVPYNQYDRPPTNYYRFSSDRYPSDEGQICPVSHLRLLKDETTAPKENRADENGEQPDKTDAKGNQQNAENNDAAGRRFKVGERVTACKIQLDDKPTCWENGTIVKDLMAEGGGDNYQILIDDPKGGKGSLYYVPAKWIRAGAPPAPDTPDCPFNEPAGSAAKTAKPSVETFKRVIFEFYKAAANGRQLGITYETFELGKSYVNRLTNNGLLHDGAPQGAMIYTVKTKFIKCDKYSDSTTRTIYDARYSCFKDNFGDWVCPSDATKISEPIYLPNK